MIMPDPKPPLRCWDCPNCEEVHGESQTYWSRFQAGEFACEVCGGPLVLRKLGGSFGEADPAQAAEQLAGADR